MMSCVDSVTVSPRSVRLQAGNWYYGARAEVSPADACVWIEWYSDKPEVAGVNRSSGYIYAYRAGTAKIYARAVDDCGTIVASDYITVTVSSVVPVRSVTLDRTVLSLEEGDSFTLDAMICPENATNQELNWRSTDTSVATVCYGEVIARKPGHTCIIAEAADGSGAFAECDVYVTAAVLTTSVTVYPSIMQLRVGESAFLHAEVCPEDADDKSLVWVSVDPSVATVTSTGGLVFAQSVGRTTIKAVPQDGGADPGECVLTVLPPIHVTGITLDTTSLTMNVGETATLNETVCPSNATNKRVTWCSSNENVACVDYYTGEITANAPGEATITARTVDGSLSASCTARVAIEHVTIKKDEFYNYVEFESSGKIWKCVNRDTIYDEEYVENSIEGRRACYNFFTNYNEEDNTINDATPREYTDDEIKLLYAIDPYGVADYVKRYADEEFYKGDGLKSNIAYKDRIFRLLYNRDPEYFTRGIAGTWGRIIEPIDPDEVNWSTIISESETLFEMHPVYDIHTAIEFASVAIEILGLACPEIAALQTMVKIAARVLSVGEAVVKNDLASFAVGSVIEKAFEDTDIEWALKLVSSFDDWMGIFNSIIDTPNYTGELVTYCAKHPNYLVFAELGNGEKRLLDDICDEINN